MVTRERQVERGEGNVVVRDATPEDEEAIRVLLPRLADFELPARRWPEHLWEGDAELFRSHFAGERSDGVARVATPAARPAEILGATLSTVRFEPLSGEPSAHLEVLVLAESAEGRGLGRRLLEDTQREVALRGARSMTLHVIATNQRARALYERTGYFGEMLRYIRPLGPDGGFPAPDPLDSRARRLLDFWFGAEAASLTDGEISERQSPLWWRKDEATDRTIRERFEVDLRALLRGELEHWESTPEGWLAQLLLLDQVPRNVYRDDPRSFAFDERARELCQQGIKDQIDLQLRPIQRLFAYLPLEHSESLEDQLECRRCMLDLVPLASETERGIFEGFVDFADKHRVIIERFGRFPHRNAVLGRESTAEELAFLEQPDSSF